MGAMHAFTDVNFAWLLGIGVIPGTVGVPPASERWVAGTSPIPGKPAVTRVERFLP
jgi:hypothetical protein